MLLFLNQYSTFQLFAVEMEYYKHASFEIVIPKLIGAEVRRAGGAAATNPTAQQLLVGIILSGGILDPDVLVRP